MAIFYSDVVTAIKDEKRVRNQNLRGKLLSTTVVLPACTAAADCIIQIANFSPSDSIKSLSLTCSAETNTRAGAFGLRAIDKVSGDLIRIGADTVFGAAAAMDGAASSIFNFFGVTHNSNKTLYELLTRELDGRTVPTAGYAPHVDKRLALILTRTVGNVVANNEVANIQYVSASSAGTPTVGIALGRLIR